MLPTLPEYCQERLRWLQEKPAASGGKYLLYWMHNALRAHENPALDTAILLAEHLGLPIFVYQGLSERYPYASDRHHAFILQGAKDVHAELAQRGIGSVFHLERPGQREAYLRYLAESAAVVITEDFPTEPLTGWVRGLAASCPAPIGLVDTACIVPMKMVGQAYERAFLFRKATESLREKRVNRPWPMLPYRGQRFIPEPLPFDPVDLQTADLRRLIRDCDIDHGVGPVAHSRGGSRAGYARWTRFLRSQLERYAADRNDPLRAGVSRMSAYLHYGMVSPFRIAREAAQSRAAGAAKYLEELLIWRELAYAFCYYRDDHASLSAIPAWARQTLQEHQNDPRPARYDWETLARGRTGDPLWDAAQRSLLIQGELHNNVRMTWGKAFLSWTANAEEALRLMIDLNHRYALDGRDPASYGGLLWCLGQFDRPFTPIQPILGTVRPRTTEDHSARLDPEAYLAWVTRPGQTPLPRVAVIGGGIAGLTAARTLHDHGVPVEVFDKGRGPGGRTATRHDDSGISFDHGAQYFTARNPIFSRHVQAWIQQGIVAEWRGKIVTLKAGSLEENRPLTRYVGVPGMSAVANHLASDLPLHRQTRISAVAPSENRWTLLDTEGNRYGPFDRLVLALPAPQATELLRSIPDGSAIAEEAAKVAMSPCWAVMVAFATPVSVDWDGAFIHDSPLSWLARNSSKPGRNRGKVDAWVLHGTPDWSRQQLERPAEDVAAELFSEFSRLIGRSLPEAIIRVTHRWRYSLANDPANRGTIVNDAATIILCGDWLCGGRVEGAFLSGRAAAGEVLREVGMPIRVADVDSLPA